MKKSDRTLVNAVDWHSKHAKAYSRNFSGKRSFIERLSVWAQLIDKYSQDLPAALDLGCGDGSITVSLSKKCRSVCAVDASKEMLALAADRVDGAGITNVKFVLADIFEFQGIADQKFDLIISSSVFEYLDDIALAFDLVAALLQEKGILLVSIPNRKSVFRKVESRVFKMFGRPYYFRYVKQVLDLQQLVDVADESGLTYQEHEYYGSGKTGVPGLRWFFGSKFVQPLIIAAFRLQSEAD